MINIGSCHFMTETKISQPCLLFLTGLQYLDSTMGDKLKSQAEKREITEFYKSDCPCFIWERVCLGLTDSSFVYLCLPVQSPKVSSVKTK